MNRIFDYIKNLIELLIIGIGAAAVSLICILLSPILAIFFTVGNYDKSYHYNNKEVKPDGTESETTTTNRSTDG